MSTTEAIAPTRERLRKVSTTIERPDLNQKVKREAYRIVPLIETLHKQGRISDECRSAGEKLARHVYGAWRTSGVTSAYGERITGRNDDGLDNRVHHGSMLASARTSVNDARIWDALITVIEETETPETLGRAWLGCKQRGQAYIAGVALIAMGLDRLARHWRMYREVP